MLAEVRAAKSVVTAATAGLAAQLEEQGGGGSRAAEGCGVISKKGGCGRLSAVLYSAAAASSMQEGKLLVMPHCHVSGLRAAVALRRRKTRNWGTGRGEEQEEPAQSQRGKNWALLGWIWCQATVAVF